MNLYMLIYAAYMIPVGQENIEDYEWQSLYFWII